MRSHNFLIFALALFSTVVLFGGVSIPLTKKVIYEDCQPKNGEKISYCFVTIQQSYFFSDKCLLVIVNSQIKPFTEAHGFAINSPWSCQDISAVKYRVDWLQDHIKINLNHENVIEGSPPLTIQIPNFFLSSR